MWIQINKSLRFLQKYWLTNEKLGQGTHCTKVGTDKSSKNTQMPQNLSTQIVYPHPKLLDFNEKKASLGVRSP